MHTVHYSPIRAAKWTIPHHVSIVYVMVNWARAVAAAAACRQASARAALCLINSFVWGTRAFGIRWHSGWDSPSRRITMFYQCPFELSTIAGRTHNRNKPAESGLSYSGLYMCALCVSTRIESRVNSSSFSLHWCVVWMGGNWHIGTKKCAQADFVFNSVPI